jgi:hypothetical protein
MDLIFWIYLQIKNSRPVKYCRDRALGPVRDVTWFRISFSVKGDSIQSRKYYVASCSIMVYPDMISERRENIIFKENSD